MKLRVVLPYSIRTFFGPELIPVWLVRSQVTHKRSDRLPLHYIGTIITFPATEEQRMTAV